MYADGIIRFLGDAGIDPSDSVTLVLVAHMKATTVGELTLDQFVTGLGALNVTSIDDLKKACPRLRTQLYSDEKMFRMVYLHAYPFNCPPGIKCLQQDVAIALWNILMPPRQYEHLAAWIAFLEKNHNKAISRDTWNMFLDFTTSVGKDFADYDADDGAWPVLMDEFVTHMRGSDGKKSTTVKSVI